MAIRNSPSIKDFDFLTQFIDLRTLEVYADVDGLGFSPVWECKFIEKLVIHSPQLTDLSVSMRLARLTHIDVGESLNLKTAVELNSRKGKTKIQQAKLPYSKMYDDFEFAVKQGVPFGSAPENQLDDVNILDAELFGDAELDPFLSSRIFMELENIMTEERNYD